MKASLLLLLLLLSAFPLLLKAEIYLNNQTLLNADLPYTNFVYDITGVPQLLQFSETECSLLSTFQVGGNSSRIALIIWDSNLIAVCRDYATTALSVLQDQAASQQFGVLVFGNVTDWLDYSNMFMTDSAGDYSKITKPMTLASKASMKIIWEYPNSTLTITQRLTSFNEFATTSPSFAAARWILVAIWALILIYGLFQLLFSVFMIKIASYRLVSIFSAVFLAILSIIQISADFMNSTGKLGLAAFYIIGVYRCSTLLIAAGFVLYSWILALEGSTMTTKFSVHAAKWDLRISMFMLFLISIVSTIICPIFPTISIFWFWSTACMAGLIAPHYITIVVVYGNRLYKALKKAMKHDQVRALLPRAMAFIIMNVAHWLWIIIYSILMFVATTSVGYLGAQIFFELIYICDLCSILFFLGFPKSETSPKDKSASSDHEEKKEKYSSMELDV